MYGRLAAGCGYTFREIGRMTLPQINTMFDYWRDNPPSHELVAMLARVYTSWKPAERAAQPGAPVASRAMPALADAIAHAGEGGMVVGRGIPLIDMLRPHNRPVAA